MDFTESLPFMKLFGSFAYGPIAFMMIFGLIFGIFTGLLAGEKGYSAVGWFISGFFFGPIALLTAIGLPDKFLQNALLEKLGSSITKKKSEGLEDTF